MDSGEFVLILLATCGWPLLCLARSRFLLLRGGDLAHAARLARIARVWSLGLMGGQTAIAALLYWKQPRGWMLPEAMLPSAALVPIWFWSKTLYERIRERQNEAARAAMPIVSDTGVIRPRDGDAGPAAPG